jgi:hypothetical protein
VRDAAAEGVNIIAGEGNEVGDADWCRLFHPRRSSPVQGKAVVVAVERLAAGPDIVGGNGLDGIERVPRALVRG